MSNQQTASIAFVIVAALISVSAPQASLAAGKFGIGAPVVKQTSVVQAREIQVSSTGDGSASEDECKKYEAGINSWGEAEVEATERLDERSARRAKFNVDNMIEEATDRGCFIIY